MRTKTLLLFAAVLTLFSNTASSQFNVRYRPTDVVTWSDSVRLTWKNFRVSTSDEIGAKSITHVILDVIPFERKEGNTVFSDCIATVNLVRSKSPYDPIKCDKWDLRYSQLIFDIAELSLRDVLTEDLTNPSTEYRYDTNFDRLYNARLKALKLCTADGQDSAAFLSLEKEVHDRLAATPKHSIYSYLNNNFIDSITNASSVLDFHIGYANANVLGSHRGDFKSFHGMNWGFSLHRKKFRYDLDWEMYEGKFLKESLWYDPELDYTWTANEKVMLLVIKCGLGYSFLTANHRFRITPNAGFSFSDLSQSFTPQNEDPKTDKEKSSSLPGGAGGYCGVDFDWIIRQHVTPMDMYAHTLRFKVFGLYNGHPLLNGPWTLNLGLSYVLTDKTLFRTR